MSSKGYIWEDWSDEEGEKGKADSPKSSRTIADLEKVSERFPHTEEYDFFYHIYTKLTLIELIGYLFDIF